MTTSNDDVAKAKWRELFAESTSPFHTFSRDFPQVLAGYPARPTLERQQEYDTAALAGAATPDASQEHNPENFFFKHNDVGFFGINEVNTKTDTWTGQNARNAAWVQAKLGEDTQCSLKSLVVFSQRGMRSAVRNAILSYQSTCGEIPVLNITGDKHPFVYCSNTNTSNNFLKITVEAFKAAPLLISIVQDPSDGQHDFHIQSTSTTTAYGECASFTATQ